MIQSPAETPVFLRKTMGFRSEPEATNPPGTDDADLDDWDDDSDEPEQAANQNQIQPLAIRSGSKKEHRQRDIQQAEAEKGQSTTKDKADEAQPKKRRRSANAGSTLHPLMKTQMPLNLREMTR